MIKFASVAQLVIAIMAYHLHKTDAAIFLILCALFILLYGILEEVDND